MTPFAFKVSRSRQMGLLYLTRKGFGLIFIYFAADWLLLYLKQSHRTMVGGTIDI